MVATSPEMDKPRDTRRRQFSKPDEPAGTDTGGLASEKTRRKFQRLSLVGRASSTLSSIDGEKAMRTSDVSDKDEELRKVVRGKRVKLPRKSMEHCNTAKQEASVPRKLRSAMKKRGRESFTPPMSESKKPVYSTHHGESPQRDDAKKTKEQGRSDSGFSGSITQDEKEVVDALYSLAGVFLNNNTGCKSFSTDEESSRAHTSPVPVPGGTETSTIFACEATEEKAKLSAPSCNEERLSEEAMRTRCLDGPITPQQLELLDCKLFNKVEDSNAGTDMWITSSHSGSDKNTDEVHASHSFVLASESNIGAHVNHPEKMDLLLHQRIQECKDVAMSVNENRVDLRSKVDDRQNNGPVLWPGLSSSVLLDESGPMQVCTSKVPLWLNRACSTDGLTESSSPIEKVPRNGVYKVPRKKSVRHVFICHLIQALKLPESKEKLQLQPNSGRHGETGLRVNSAESDFNFFSDFSSRAFANMIASNSPRSSYQARNAVARQNKHSQGLNSSLSGNEVNFLSLSTSVGGFSERPSAPHVNSMVQQPHMLVGLPASKTYNPRTYPEELSGMTTLQQLPPYLGNLGRSFLQQGSVVISKEQHHQNMFLVGPTTTTLLKPSGNLKAVSQFPVWQSGRMEPYATVPFASIVHPPPHPASSIETLGPKHSQPLPHVPHLIHLQQQQQQQQQHLISLQSPLLPTIKKSQDSLLHPARDEAAPRLHSSSAMPLQLLCNEYL
ncbi:hypothetical protein SAY87_032074 [Trapa incisa]|uniref:Uncharacterized protein n=1 Tax=Trapa incisa TaxID=236973 RepID=A0AAN7QLI5_9MYRT|nr:hypothetical protein SAY87_032074 [Trapa incisa]